MSAGRKPRIAFLIHDLRDGGAERVTISLANGAAERGLDVDLVLINRTGKGSYFQSVDPRVRIASLPQGRTLTSAFGFRSYFDQARPDAAVSALTHVNIAAILGKMLSRCKPRLVVVEHNQMSKNIRRKRGFVRLAYAAVPRLYRRADIVGVVSEGVKQDFVEFTGFPGERVDVFYNPVVTP
ncbi:MAG: glycosyltransferase, partial [Geminicoccaceae bacterium]